MSQSINAMVQKYSKKFLDIVEYFKKQIPINKNIPKVLLLGSSGAGKSALFCSLSDKKLTIKSKQFLSLLDGEGVYDGTMKGTQFPSFYYDSKNNYLLVDFPGFDSEEEEENEIFNEYFYFMLFDSDELKSKLKIAIVISASEFLVNRMRCVKKSFEFLKKKNIDIKKYQTEIALVISKGNENGIYLTDYIRNARLFPETEEWLQYLITNNQFFVFNSPSRKNIGNRYDFRDRERLIKFFKREYLYDPIINYGSLSQKSQTILVSVKEIYIQKLYQVMIDFSKIITEQYQEFLQVKICDYWINALNLLLEKKITQINDFQENVKDVIQQNDLFCSLFQKLSDYYTPVAFINLFFKNEIVENFQDIIKKSILSDIEKIKKYKNTVQTFEEKNVQLQKELEEKNKIISELNHKKDT